MKNLTDKKRVSSEKGTRLTNSKNETLFKLAICEQLDNNFCFKDLKNPDIKHLHKFIDETIGKNLTISIVDKLYLRTKGQIQQEINGRDVIHYGKDNQPFRIFGYYNSDGYFNITRIDPKHKTHKS
ncbi:MULTISPECIES: MAG6450 family protein [Streptococcus]|uniref:MAG6450 family protein n=1 Tax=Streptococcus TaxID=1301 RepID=UPI0008A9D33E|nr:MULTISPECIES: hypothetical protein [Streptococcus]MCW0945145.1 hypothetical protein [Streptococcus anginosus]MCW1082778.1 hypothetical protein [Streptococcus anginosus]MDI7735428.1 hypothetical protein [Streptococcus anginosus]MED5790140.1 hypothetical protein [Streptococcus anginosus]MED5865565.1 hypothetical protein [Streptococcus anginosus]